MSRISSNLLVLIFSFTSLPLTPDEIRDAVEEYNRLRGQLFVLAEVAVFVDRELENIENNIDQRRLGLDADGVPVGFHERPFP